MVTVTPLGGLGEIGMNSLVVEAAGERLLVDCGVMFPHEFLPGVDVIHPDFHHLEQAPHRLKAVLLTHAHEDHHGALPELLSRFKVPVYGTRFSLAVLRRRLEERGLEADLRECAPRHGFRVGEAFSVEPLRVAHSVPDAVGFSISSGGFRLVHSGDFKFDETPMLGAPTDTARLGELGDEGVDGLLSDSTNALVHGPTPSEAEVAAALGPVVAAAPGRVIVVLFSSHLSRMAHLCDAAQKCGRRVLFLGRSIVRNVALASEAGVFDPPSGLVVSLEDARSLAPEKTLIIATGAQGEARSAMSTLLTGDGSVRPIGPTDTVILSARSIPGNEPAIVELVDRVLLRGARVVDSVNERRAHVSGHAARDDQARLLKLLRPRTFVPLHGTVRHLEAHAALARECGVAPGGVVRAVNGDVVTLEGSVARITDQVQAQRILKRRESWGQLTSEGLSERRALSLGLAVVSVVVEAGTGVVASPPRLVTRGLATDEAAALPSVQSSLEEAMDSLSRLERCDPERVRLHLENATRSAFKRLVGPGPTVLGVVSLV